MTGIEVEPHVGRALLEQRHEGRVGGLVAVGVGAHEAQQRVADDAVLDRLARGETARQRLVDPAHAAQDVDDAGVVVDADTEALRRCRGRGLRR